MLGFVPASGIVPAPPEGLPDEEPLAAFLKRAEVRDVLAWLRLLADPNDAAAVVRALSRPPIELRQVELARVIQVARRHKPDLVRGLAAAAESPHVPPEARERIQRFVALHASAAAELSSASPDASLARLIELLDDNRGLLLLDAPELAARRAAHARLQRLADDYVRSTPRAGARELVRHLAAVAPDAQGERHGKDDSPVGDGELQGVLAALREEVLDGISRIGGRLGELRLDTDLDISHGVVRYLELLKLSALLQRPAGQSVADALIDINARLAAAVTPLQREILLTSTLDRTLLDTDAADGAPGRALVPREQHSLVPFLPRRGVGLALSASDIHTYRSCPQRYKFARVLRIPTEQTDQQRFGILVHQVLERYHRGGGQTLAQLLGMLEDGWRRAGIPLRGRCGESARAQDLLQKARAALASYHARLQSEDARPVWFERPFSFQLGPHRLRGRVDRVDQRGEGPGAQYELIDYKTSRPKSATELRTDIQLSLYALAAREDWQLRCTRQSYHYVLDDLKVPLAYSETGTEAVRDVVLAVGEGILAQEFAPTPSPGVCSSCDYRIVCPAAAG